MFHTVVEDGSGALFQIRSISCCSMLLGVTTYMIRYTVSNQEEMHVAVVGDCFILCQVCCFNNVEDTFIHFQVMLSIQKHGRSGITKRRNLLGREASIITKGRKNLTRKLMVYTTMLICVLWIGQCKIHCALLTFVKGLCLMLIELLIQLCHMASFSAQIFQDHEPNVHAPVV